MKRLLVILFILFLVSCGPAPGGFDVHLPVVVKEYALTYPQRHLGLSFECADMSNIEKCKDQLLATGVRWDNVMIWVGCFGWTEEQKEIISLAPPNSNPWIHQYMRGRDSLPLLPQDAPQVVIDLQEYLASRPNGKIQLGNEPNELPGPESVYITPGLYAEYVYEWTQIIRAVAPEAQIAWAGMGQHAPPHPWETTLYLDAVADYWETNYVEPIDVNWLDQHFYFLSDAARQLDDLEAWRDGRLPDAAIMVSEFGLPCATGTEPSLVVDRMDRMISFFEKRRVPGAIIWYALWNHSQIFEDAFLQMEDGSPRPLVYDAFSGHAGGK